MANTDFSAFSAQARGRGLPRLRPFCWSFQIQFVLLSSCEDVYEHSLLQRRMKVNIRTNVLQIIHISEKTARASEEDENDYGTNDIVPALRDHGRAFNWLGDMEIHGKAQKKAPSGVRGAEGAQSALCTGKGRQGRWSSNRRDSSAAGTERACSIAEPGNF